MPTPRRTTVVTDSTAALPQDLRERWGIDVVPLHVHAGDATYLEGVDLDAAATARLVGSVAHVTTSQPTPAMFAAAYGRAAAAGATEIVSVHLSGELSGTVHAAALASQRGPVPVHVVDSRTVAGALGAAAVGAARAAAAGASGADAAAAATATSRTARAVFLVDSLDHLRRGGRLGRAASTVGTMLGMRPLLTVRDGRIDVLAKVRTRAAATARLVQEAEQHARGLREPSVTVHHLDTPDDAAALADALGAGLGVPVAVTPVGAVLAAHVGPGLLAVVVADEQAR